MTSEEELRLKLRKIEALFEGAGTSGKKQAAEAARERIKAKLAEAAKWYPRSNIRLHYKIVGLANCSWLCAVVIPSSLIDMHVNAIQL